MSNTLRYSSELMKNYIHASVVSPLSDFVALQTANGNSLLFAIGSNNALNVITEESGTSQTGWKNIDLSTAQITKSFQGQSTALCSSFGVAQSVVDGSIGIGIVVRGTVSKNDILHLCLNNSNTDLNWLNQPNWVAFPYDNKNTAIAYKGYLVIEKIFFTETANGLQHIVVDILRDSTSAVKEIKRFTIDPTKANGTAWLEYDLAIDIESEAYSSCLGRIANNSPIDGLYTMGKAGTCNQIVFTPVINYWGLGPVNPSILYLPNGLKGEAMASVRNEELNTELFVTSNNGLYFFSQDDQANDSPSTPITGTLLFTNPIFHNVRKLFAYNSNGTVYIWGINGSNQVFYTTCTQGQEANPKAWSVPLPILTQVDLLSPYVNLVDGGNTFFAVDANGFYKMVQSPQTTIWTQQYMHLPPPSSTSAAIQFSSYTTKIDLVDKNNQPLADTSVNISTKTRTCFYINNLYYIIDNQATAIKTDVSGSITIIECVNNLNGTPITISDNNGTSITVNPMDKPMNKIATLTSTEAVSDATITYQNGSTKKLVSSSATPVELQTIAASNEALAKAYKEVSNTNVAIKTMSHPLVGFAHPNSLQSVPNVIVTELGNIFRYLYSGVEAIVNIIKDAASDVYHFVVKIADKVYSAILDCAEKVVAAIEYVYNVVKTTIEDIIHYLEFLFNIDDLKRTQQVIKNITNLFLKQQVENLKTLKISFDESITDLEAKFNALLGGSPNLNGIGNTNINTQSNPTLYSSAASSLVTYHFNANINNATVTALATQTINAPDNVFDVLIQLVENEEEYVINTVQKLVDVLKNANNMTVVEIMKQIVETIGDLLFDTVKNVIDATFDVVILVADKLIELLNDHIYIPVVSDILKVFGVQLPSIMDVLTWVTAVPVTLVYKLAFQESPFPDNETTKKYITASSFKDLFAPKKQLKAMNTKLLAATPFTTSSAEDKTGFRAFHIISAVASILNTPVSIEDALSEAPTNPAGTASTFWSILSGISWGIGGLLWPQAPVKDTGFKIASEVFLGLRIANKVITSGKVPKIQQHRKIGSVIDSIIGLANLVFTIEHFVELGKEDSSNPRTLAILDETSLLLSYIARWGYCTTVCIENPYVKIGGSVAIGLGNLGFAGLQIAEAATYDQ